MGIFENLFSSDAKRVIRESNIDYTVTVKKIDNGLFEERWVLPDGKTSRLSKPALTIFDSNKNKIIEKFIINGIIIKSEEKPSVIEYYETGVKKKVIYISPKDNKRCELDFNNNGILICKSFFSIVDGQYVLGQLLDAPSKIEYYSTGRIKKKRWFVDGKRDRNNIFKPIYIHYDENGNKINSIYINSVERYLKQNKLDIEKLTDEDKYLLAVDYLIKK